MELLRTPFTGRSTATLATRNPVGAASVTELPGVAVTQLDVADPPPAVVLGGPDARGGVAEWSVDPATADRLWELAAKTL